MLMFYLIGGAALVTALMPVVSRIENEAEAHDRYQRAEFHA